METLHVASTVSHSILFVEALQRNRTHKMCAYRKKVIYFKEWTPTTVETGKFKICRLGWQGEDQGRASAAVQVLLAEFILAQGRSVLVLLAPSTN